MKRWEYNDWNLEREIIAFGNRIQCEMDQFKFSQLVNGDNNDEYIIAVLKKITDKVPSIWSLLFLIFIFQGIRISDASEQICRHLSRLEMLDSAARSVGFHYLVPNYDARIFGTGSSKITIPGLFSKYVLIVVFMNRFDRRLFEQSEERYGY